MKIKKTYYDDKKINTISYYNDNGIIHREGKPAMRKYYKDGSLEMVAYFENGVHHRYHKPAQAYYFKNGQLKEINYYLHGDLHRENGPAKITYDSNGKVKNKYYFIKGKKIYNKDIIAELEANKIKY